MLLGQGLPRQRPLLIDSGAALRHEKAAIFRPTLFALNPEKRITKISMSNVARPFRIWRETVRDKRPALVSVLERNQREESYELDIVASRRPQ